MAAKGYDPRAMPWIRTVPVGTAQGPLARLYQAAIQRAGRVFKIVELMSAEPAVLESSLGLYRAVMHSGSELSRAERELLAVTVSVANRCHY
jgi:alkylhydroperoxidase family enzyme